MEKMHIRRAALLVAAGCSHGRQVPPAWLTTWNQILAPLIASLQVVGDTLSPFVSIRYLQRSN